MSTSAIERALWRKYLLAAVCCAVFAAVYECFSHGVISKSMLCFPLVPLAAGLRFLPLGGRKRFRSGPRSWSVQLWHCASATVALGLLLSGVINIYGTDEVYTVYFMLAGALLALLSVITGLKRA